MSSQSRRLSRPETDRVTRSGYTQTSSPGAKAVHEPNINYELTTSMAYRVADVTLYPVPEASSIVTAIIRCNESKLPPNPIALDPSILSLRGQVIRITQVSQDSWLLLGCRYGNGASNPCTRRSLTVLSADRKSNPHTDAADHDADHPDSHVGEEDEDEDEDGEEDTTEYKPYARAHNHRLGPCTVQTPIG